MKVGAKLTAEQLRRHAATAKRAGFDPQTLVAITVEIPDTRLPPGTITRQWRDLYSWFAQRDSKWAGIFVNYMETFEARAIAMNYELRGAITMFNGLRFDADSPYTYREGKRLIRLMGDELQARADLRDQLGVDPQGLRRTAITGASDDGRGFVWDFIPLRVACGATFTSFPHLTMVLRDNGASAAITVPNGVSGGFRTRLKDKRFDGFIELIREIEGRLRPVIKSSHESRATMYATQRHYLSQRSEPSEDRAIAHEVTN